MTRGILIRLIGLSLILTLFVGVGCSENSNGLSPLASKSGPPPAEIPNKAPVIKTIDCSNFSVYPNGVVDLEVKAFDPDEDVLSYNFDINDGQLSTDGYKASWELPDKLGIYPMKITVTDGEYVIAEEIFVTVEEIPTSNNRQ